MPIHPVTPPPRGSAILVLALLCSCGLPAAAAAQRTLQAATLHSVTGTAPPIALAVPARDAPPTIDGKLDDPAWRASAVITAFTQVLPNDGSDPSERTEVRITFDADALYICGRLYDSDPGGIVGRLGRRDSYTSSDGFTVSIDSYHDHRTAFRFGVNPAGVRSDEITTNDDDHGDDSWDPVWKVVTTIDSVGWTAEMRIPFSQLRFSAADVQVWGINFSRTIFRKNELVRWSWVPNTEEGFASHFGHLDGITGIKPPRRLELLPYTVAKTDHTEAADPSNPFNDGSVQDVTAGLDVKYGLTSDLTVDATFNPDFGQVEADPAVVNLSAFETFFSERRPFFVEGANIFRFGAGSGGFTFGAPQLFYSRRIGRAPSRSAGADDAFVYNPTATRIVGATKLSGKTGRWSIGILDALTAREVAKIQQVDGDRTTEPVEPLTNYGVVSVRRDLREGASGVGLLATSVNRRLDDAVFNQLRSAAYSGGLDFFHRFGRNRYAVSGTLSASYIRGAAAAITAAQQSSARYYQRPGQHYVAVDSSATSLSGWAASLQAGKVAGNWTLATDFFAYSPGFEVNDAGFQTQTDRIFHGIRLARRWLDPGSVFRNFRINATWAQNWNFGGTRLWREVYVGAGGQFLNYWHLNVGANFGFGGQSDKATRGGPLMETPRQWSLQASFGSDFRKPVSLGAFGYYARNRYGGWGGEIGTDLNLRPTDAVSLSISPNVNKTNAMAFYVTQVDDPTAVATFGRRYLFSQLRQTSINTTIRMDVALSPNLSVQLWAQPYISSGDYRRFKELTRPGSFEFLRYGEDGESSLSYDAENNEYSVDPDGAGPAEPIGFGNPDFRFRSLRSNLVLRWEYSPGSTLFLVWNHGQSGSSDDPHFGFFREFGRMFGDDQQNTFVVKFNYWLSL